MMSSLLVKPTLDTKFHIDFGWWAREGRELKVDVAKHVKPEFLEALNAYAGGEVLDEVDAETGEVRQVDMLQYMLRTQCKPLETFLTEHTSLVDVVFHTFLANGNRPLSPNELAEKLNRPANTILRTLAGRTVYKGLRPVMEE